jgi:hypothetical protein
LLPGLKLQPPPPLSVETPFTGGSPVAETTLVVAAGKLGATLELGAVPTDVALADSAGTAMEAVGSASETAGGALEAVGGAVIEATALDVLTLAEGPGVGPTSPDAEGSGAARAASSSALEYTSHPGRRGSAARSSAQ